MNSLNTLDQLLEALRAVAGSDAEKRVATEAAITLKDELTKSLAAGQDPDGQAWSPTKAGGRAYAGAASKLSVEAIGNIVSAEITGPEVFAQRGTARLPKRQMLPESGGNVPRIVADALNRAADTALTRLLAGKDR